MGDEGEVISGTRFGSVTEGRRVLRLPRVSIWGGAGRDLRSFHNLGLRCVIVKRTSCFSS